ncbi:MAG: hypothetical protein KA792_04940 [Bacteroidales bacterium]|nr:hypothetical protein [Bacteroidales bacterium]
MKLRKDLQILLFIAILLLIDIAASAQGWKRYRREAFISLGATNFLGELGGANDIGTNGILDFDFPSIRPAMNLGYRYRIAQRAYLKGTYTYGILSGNDKFTWEKYRNHRNLHFRSPIHQLHSQLEFFILREREGHKYDIQGVKGWKNIRISTYVFIGVGALYFNPKAQYLDPKKGDKKWYSLRQFSTEGEGLVPTRKKYSVIQPVVPIGIGFKYAFAKDWSIGIEYSLYKTFTDYLDDVSCTYFDDKYLKVKRGDKAIYFANPHKKYYGTLNWKTTAPGQQRGDPRDKDSYMFAFVTLYYRIAGGRFVIPLF